MKHSIFLILFLCAGANAVSAQTNAAPLGTQNVPQPPQENRIGVVAAVSGKVTSTDDRSVGRVIGSGAPIFMGDTVSTDETGQLQIILKDQTVFTIGPNSSIVIDQFVYDPDTEDGKVHASITKGVFRFVTGKIARKKPEHMELSLPVGTIGIRGTFIAGEVSGGNSLVALLGPAEKNRAGQKPGSFVLSNEVGGKTESTHVTRTGFGAQIEGADSAPSRAFKLPSEVIAKLTNDFAAPSEGAEKSKKEDASADNKKGTGTQQGPMGQTMPGLQIPAGGPDPQTMKAEMADFMQQAVQQAVQAGVDPAVVESKMNDFMNSAMKEQMNPEQMGRQFMSMMHQMLGDSFDPIATRNQLFDFLDSRYGGDDLGEMDDLEGDDLEFDPSNGPFQDGGFEFNIDLFDAREFHDLLELSAQDVAFLEQFGGPDSNTSTYEELRSLSGQKHYFISDANTTQPSTYYDFQVDVDFDTHSVGAGNSHAVTGTSTGIGDFQFDLGADSFNAQPGDVEAPFVYLGLANVGSGCVGCTADVSFSFNNANLNPVLGDENQIATYARHSVQIKNSSGDIIAGTLVGSDVLERANGLSS